MTRVLMRKEEWNQAVFDESYKLYYERILHFLERTLKDRSKAEDLTQETFLKLYRQLGDREQPDHIVNWLYRVATNLCRDYWRSSCFQKERPYIHDIKKLNSSKQEPDPCVLGEMCQELQNVLNSLSPHYRHVIRLRYFHELRLDEVAEVIECPVGTVKSRLFNGLRALRTKIQANGREPHEFYDLGR